MRLPKIFSVGKDVVQAIKDLAVVDKNFQNDLTQAGGLISLAGICLRYYEKYQQKLKSSEEKAFASLLKYVLQTTQDLLADVKYTEERKAGDQEQGHSKFQNNLKTMQEELLGPFEQSSDWNSYLPSHPAIQKFRTKIIEYLKKENYDSNVINEFAIRFNLELENKAGNDSNINEFYGWWTIQQEYRELVKYLEHIKI